MRYHTACAHPRAIQRLSTSIAAPESGSGAIGRSSERDSNRKLWFCAERQLFPRSVGAYQTAKVNRSGEKPPAESRFRRSLRRSQSTGQRPNPRETCASGCDRIQRRTAFAAELAERVGFEPTVGLHLLRFSRPTRSTTLPPLRGRVRPISAAAAARNALAATRAPCPVRGAIRIQRAVDAAGRPPL